MPKDQRPREVQWEEKEEEEEEAEVVASRLAVIVLTMVSTLG
jgi:hypothetical protein